MLFVEFDHGAIVRKGTGRATPRMTRFVIGNPLIMRQMVQHVPDAGSYAPVTILIDERSNNSEALRVARDLDEKVEALLSSAAG
jgi:uncharacterized protein (DUF302 family)